MYCSNCGSAIPENDNIRFCPECGSPLMPQMQVPQNNAGAAVPQQAGIARGYGGEGPSVGYTPGGPGYGPQGAPAQGSAAGYGAAPSVGYTPGAGFPPPPGVPGGTAYPGPNVQGTPQNGRPEEKGSGGSNKKYLAVVIPLIGVIIAALTVIFIFIVYPEIKKDTEATPDGTASAQQTENVSESPGADASVSAPAQDTAETESVTAAAPVRSAGYSAGQYVNSTESRVHIRNTTNKNGKHLEYIQPDEYIDVFEVLDLGSSAEATVRWWGKVMKSGKTGWVSLYYLTCVDLAGTQLDAGQIDQLWQSLQGYWNTLDKKRYTAFSTENGSPYFVYSPWSGSAIVSAYADAEGMGDINGLVKLRLRDAADGSAGEVTAELYLDLSEMKNGRLAWSFGVGWEDGYYAGTDQSKAKPKSR